MSASSIVVYNHNLFENVQPEMFTLHEHDVYELMLFVKIKGSYFAEGRAYKVAPNDIILIPPSLQHRFFIEAGSDYDRYDILIDQNLIDPELKSLLPSIHDIISVGSNDLVLSLFSELDRFEKLLECPEPALDSLVRTILYNVYLLSKEKEERRSAQLNPLVSKATDYINKNLFTLSGVEEVCRELYVTKSHLHHIFQKYLMTTPKKYITSKRLYEAQRLIRGGSAPSDVYAACGFSDYATFYRNYKELFGYPPSREGEVEIVREQYI